MTAINPAHYRADIDGLRAVAVLSVVLYHAGFPRVTGGFVGVDIFFVISGFLIAGILLREIANGTFSLARFYERRARRILPALFVVLGTSLLIGWILSWPADFQQLAQSTLATLVFGSNIHFWQTTEYFARGAEYQPLLHTWSLGVEEQFYILFPLLLAFLAGSRLGVISLVFIALFLASFLSSAFLTHVSPAASFYLTPIRAWELLLGAILALNVMPDWSNRLVREFAAIIGLGLIFIAVFFLDSSVPFPGFAALLPCLGTALIIQSGMGNGSITSIARMLSSGPAVGMGLVSYSFYLWHWPILAFSKAWSESPRLPILDSLLLVVMSLVLAIMSWRFVEQPFRNATKVPLKCFVQLAVASFVVLAALSTVVLSNNGFESRFTAPVIDALSGANDSESNRRMCMGRKTDDSYCVIGDIDLEPTVLVWGDSHAAAMMSALSVVLKASNESAYLASHTACPPLLGVRRKNSEDWQECADFNREVLEFVVGESSSIDTVILVARWRLNVTGTRAEGESGRAVKLASTDSSVLGSNIELVKAGLQKTLNHLENREINAVILGDTPEIGWDVPRSVALRLRLGLPPPVTPTLADVQEANRSTVVVLEELAKNNGATFVEIAPLLCRQRCIILDGTKPIYVDGSHLSMHGARDVLGPRLLDDLGVVLEVSRHE